MVAYKMNKADKIRVVILTCLFLAILSTILFLNYKAGKLTDSFQTIELQGKVKTAIDLPKTIWKINLNSDTIIYIGCYSNKYFPISIQPNDSIFKPKYVKKIYVYRKLKDSNYSFFDTIFYNSIRLELSTNPNN